MVRWFVKLTPWVIAVFYGYGAIVHVLNMLGMTGFPWLEAPLKWQILDVVYLLLDIVVVVGLAIGRAFGYAAFYLAAASQIVLYTVLRDWIIDVPEKFARSAEEIAYLDTLVIFHVVTLALISAVVWLRRRPAP